MILILVLGAILALLVEACGDGGSEEPRVIATTGVVASIVEEVAGDDAEVVQLIPDSASPHDFSLSAQDRAELEDADLVAYNGAGLEAGVPIDEAEASKWALAENAGSLLPSSAEEAAEHDGAEDTEERDGDDDPHVWMDPTRVASALPSLAEALARADPGNEASYRQRAEDLAARIEDLDREIADEAEALPRAERELITSHDALSYFADRYGFEIVATAFPATGAEAEPSAAALAEVTELVESSGVPAVFSEEGDDPQVLERVAAETGVEVVDELLVESPGPAGSYDRMLRRDAETIVTALEG
jgi:zinc/manganese transport system substrate-binding protein